jgi:SAM-dependent methyltransferase
MTPLTEPFDQFRDAYEEWFVRNHESYLLELDALRQLMPSGFSSSLEVGVGTGLFAQPLGIGTGVEPSPAMAEFARNRGIKVFHGVAESLPFPDSSFDLLLMVTTVCFVDDALSAFSEARRVLTAGGCILVGFVDRESDLGQRYQENRHGSRFYRDATFYSVTEVISLLERAGLSIAETRQTLIDGEAGAILDGWGRGAFVVIKAVKLA